MAQRLPGPNDVIERADGLRVRVLLFESEIDVVHVIKLKGDPDKALPEPWKSSELLGDFRSECPQWHLVIEDKPRAAPLRRRNRLTRRTKDGKTLPPESERHDEKRWEDVHVMLQDPAVYWKQGRRAALDAYAERLGTTWKRLLRLLRLAWLNGMTAEGVRTGWYRSGVRRPQAVDTSTDQTRAASGEPAPEAAPQKGDAMHPRPRRGRPPRKRRSLGKPQYEISPQVALEIAELGLAYLRQKDVHTRRGLYGHVMREKFSYVDGNGKRQDRPESERPNRRQVRYIMDKVDDPVSALRRKLSPSTMANDKEPKLGNRLMDAHYAGHIYEIDSTIVDLWVVDRDDKSVVLGKPTLYLIIDVFSRLLVGLHLTLDPPSWSSACAALRSLSDRKGQSEKCGFDRYAPELDVADGVVGQIIRADRGLDVANNGTIEFAKDLKRSWENVAGKRGSLKGIVESQFNLIHVELKHDNVGYVEPRDVHKRKGKGYRFDQLLNLDELRRKLFAIQNLHNRRMHPGMRLPKRLVAKRIPSQPYRIFEEDEAVAGPRPRINARRLRDALLTKARATVTHQGIEVGVVAPLRTHCLHYSCKEAIASEWFIKARKATFEVDVRYDLDLTTVVYVKDPYDTRFEYEATLTEADSRYVNTDFATAAFYMLTWEDINAQAEEFNMSLRNADKDAQAEEDAAIAKQAREDRQAAGGKLRVAGNGARRQREAHDRNVEDARERAGLNTDSRNKVAGRAALPDRGSQKAPDTPPSTRGQDASPTGEVDFTQLLANPREALRSLNRG